MKPPPLRYVCARSLEEALAVLGEHGEEAKVLAGGCSLVPMLNMRLARPQVLVDVNRIAELAEVRQDADVVVTGATVRQAALEQSPLLRRTLPLAAACAPYIGHFVTRNRGTLGGSLAHADARGELPLALLTLGGSVRVRSQRGERRIAAEDLFVYHFTSALEPDELLTEVHWPAPGDGTASGSDSGRGDGCANAVPPPSPDKVLAVSPDEVPGAGSGSGRADAVSPDEVPGPGSGSGWGYGFAEMAQRHGDFALAMAACALRRSNGTVAEVRLGLGAVADRPLPATAAAEILVGSNLDAGDADAALAEAGRLAADAADPFDDLHASAAYRRHLTARLSRQAIRQAWHSAGECSP